VITHTYIISFNPLYQTADSLIHSFDPSTVSASFLPSSLNITFCIIIIGGCFCDYRRAVVAASIIFMVGCLVDVILFAIFSTTGQSAMNVYAASAIIAAILFFVNLFALVAALRYSLRMLRSALLFILIEFGWDIYESTVKYAGSSLIYGIVGTVIGYGLYIYPLVGLILEIKSGVMSKETYPREGM
jgi:hypothetical protein